MRAWRGHGGKARALLHLGCGGTTRCGLRLLLPLQRLRWGLVLLPRAGRGSLHGRRGYWREETDLLLDGDVGAPLLHDVHAVAGVWVPARKKGEGRSDPREATDWRPDKARPHSCSRCPCVKAVARVGKGMCVCAWVWW